MAPSISSFLVNGQNKDAVGAQDSIQLTGSLAGATRVLIDCSDPDVYAKQVIAEPTDAAHLAFRRTVQLNFVKAKSRNLTFTLIATDGRQTVSARIAVLVTNSDRSWALLDLQEKVVSRYGNLGLSLKQTLRFKRGPKAPEYSATHFELGKFFGFLPTAWDFQVGKKLKDKGNGSVTADLWKPKKDDPKKQNTCFCFLGMAFAKVNEIDNLGKKDKKRDRHTTASLVDPSMLFFSGRENNKLIGCGFFLNAADDPVAFGRQLFLEPEEWFFHYEGKHTDDGGFKQKHGHGKRHHPTVRDLHIFFNTDKDNKVIGVPLVGISSRKSDLNKAAAFNVPLSISNTIADRKFCNNGASIDGLFGYEEKPHS